MIIADSVKKKRFPTVFCNVCNAFSNFVRSEAVSYTHLIMCQRATDMIGELATAIANGLTSRQLMYAMRAHPTFNEAVSKAVEDSRE